MEYITVREASALWHMDISTIGKLLRAGKITEARKFGGHWLIPRDTLKPVDGRTREAKEKLKEVIFRFPLYINFPEDSFVPPLSSEESKLRQAQADFYHCEFKKAKDVFEALSENAENIYVKICAHFFMCVLSAVFDTNINWGKHFYKMNLLLSDDFPRKKEMMLFLPFLDYIIGQFALIPEKLNTESRYEYHPSAWYMNALLSVFNFSAKDPGTINAKCTEPFSTLCSIMDHNGYYIEAQELHIILFFHNYAVLNEEAMNYHLKKALHLAFEHELYLPIADAISYYPDAFNDLLCEYPEAFTNRIRNSSKIIFNNFSQFAKIIEKTNVYACLSNDDYRYVFYALQNYTNKKVADICKLSERTVAKRYNDIYDKLGINSKRELIRTMDKAFGE